MRRAAYPEVKYSTIGFRVMKSIEPKEDEFLPADRQQESVAQNEIKVSTPKF